MKYNHAVKHNGVFYPAGTDVPVKGKGRKTDEKTKDPSAEEKDSDSGGDSEPVSPKKEAESKKSGK